MNPALTYEPDKAETSPHGIKPIPTRSGLKTTAKAKSIQAAESSVKGILPKCRRKTA
jgi:hypothetical protein